MLGHTMAALAGSSSLVLTYALGIVIAVKPWWEAQYLIPIFGMVRRWRPQSAAAPETILYYAKSHIVPRRA